MVKQQTVWVTTGGKVLLEKEDAQLAEVEYWSDQVRNLIISLTEKRYTFSGDDYQKYEGELLSMTAHYLEAYKDLSIDR